MPADFPAAGTFVLSWAATYLIHSTCLLAGVWLYLRVHRGAGHALRETLWKAALVGSILSASVQMLPRPRGTMADITVAVKKFRLPSAPASDGSSATRKVHAGTSDGGTAAARSTTDTVASHAAAAAPENTGIFLVASGNPANESAAAGGEMSVPGPSADRVPATTGSMAILRNSLGREVRQLPAAGFLVIGVGAALAAILLGAARCLWQTWSLRRKLAHCSVIDSGPARRLLDDLRRLVPRVPDVLLLSAPDDPEPAAFGVRQWTIVLPARAARDLSEDELRALLAHELAHLVRGDSIWLCVSRMICSCLAFQPLNHLARREWQRAAEYLCDNWAVNRTGTPLALARCLTEVAGWRLSGRASAALLAATGRKSGLSERIERLVEAAELSETSIELRQRRRLLLAGALLLGIGVWCAPRVLVAVTAPERRQSEKPEVARSSDLEQAFAGGEIIAADNATPRANGEGASVAVETPVAEIVEAPAVPAKGNGQPPATNLAALLQSLDDELNALERDLHELEPLLKMQDVSPPVVRLAEQLRVEIGHLKQRRGALDRHWKQSIQ